MFTNSFSFDFEGDLNKCISVIRFKAIITARKRSLGQGNMFTPVCHSVHRGVCLVEGAVPGPRGVFLVLGGAWSWGVWSGGGGTAEGGMHPTGMHSCYPERV